MSSNGLKKMIKKSEKTSSFESKSNREMKSIAPTSKDDVTIALQERRTVVFKHVVNEKLPDL